MPETTNRVVLALLDRWSDQQLVKRRKWHILFTVPRPVPRRRDGRWRFPEMAMVWRRGDTAGVRVWPWWNLVTWLFTRCEGCGRRGPYGASPSYMQGHDPTTRSILVGRTGCYFHGCKPDPVVDHRNTEAWDRQWGHDDGLRRNVLGEPVHVALELSMLAQERREAEQRYRQRLIDTRREAGLDDFAWKFPRQETARGC